MPPCVILTPVSGSIEPPVDDALKELEKRGYPVWRVRGYSAIDQGRNQLATDAIEQGFEETLWIDADVLFNPDDVEKLRSHNLPLCCGIYPKKGRRELASHCPAEDFRVFRTGTTMWLSKVWLSKVWLTNWVRYVDSLASSGEVALSFGKTRGKKCRDLGRIRIIGGNRALPATTTIFRGNIREFSAPHAFTIAPLFR